MSVIDVIRADRKCLLLIEGAKELASAASPETLGFKAYNLARMASLGLNVPPAFVLGTGYSSAPETVTPEFWAPALARLEAATGQRLGDPRRPLLLSVRSGAPVSMPGMMETLLNIGLTDRTLPGMIRQTGHPRLAWDAYRRLVANFGEVVAGIEAAAFDADLVALSAGEDERALDFEVLRDLTLRHLETYRAHAGEDFPQDATVQLQQSIAAVLRSWSAEKAVTYRRLRGLDDAMGTAVTVQRMVFGNAGGLPGSGVGFTRNPSDGTPVPWIDFLFNAQGEDVVSGRRSAEGHATLASIAPGVWQELVAASATLERHFGDMQDFEFTVQEGELFLLQTRDGKRTPQAAARIALDMAEEGLISPESARARTAHLTEADLATSFLAQDDGARADPIGRAATACAGVVSGEIAFDEASVRARKAAGAKVVLVRRDVETRDIAALELADGLLTCRGARTSHAAVVARQLGKVCLVGCEAMVLDEARRRIELGEQVLDEGAVITLDGNTGQIHAGSARIVTTVPQDLLGRLKRLRQKG